MPKGTIPRKKNNGNPWKKNVFDPWGAAGAAREDKEGTAGHTWAQLGTAALASLGERCDSQKMADGKVMMMSWRMMSQEDDVTVGKIMSWR